MGQPQGKEGEKGGDTAGDAPLGAWHRHLLQHCLSITFSAKPQLYH